MSSCIGALVIMEWIEGNGIHYPSSHGLGRYLLDKWNGQTGQTTGVQVKPETVGVWTSAVDELGNKVFEGDILITVTPMKMSKALSNLETVVS